MVMNEPRPVIGIERGITITQHERGGDNGDMIGPGS